MLHGGMIEKRMIVSALQVQQRYGGTMVSETLNKSSPRRKPGSSSLISLDSDFRRNGKYVLVKGFLGLSWGAPPGCSAGFQPALAVHLDG